MTKDYKNLTDEQIAEIFNDPVQLSKYEHDTLDVPMYKAIGLVIGFYAVVEIVHAVVMAMI